MANHLALYSNTTTYNYELNNGTITRPNVSYCEDTLEVHYNPRIDYSAKYLTTVALGDGAITFTPKGSNIIYYSTDNGNTWITGNSVSVNNGSEVLWKGAMTPSSYDGIGSFSSTCNFNVYGNVMSLLYEGNFKNLSSLEGKNACFYSLFLGSDVVSAKDLILPATTLSGGCYSNMFRNCTKLTSAPLLPALVLTLGCYSTMFQLCTNLTAAPQLPATTLAASCYQSMFSGCTNINYIKAMFTTTPSTTYTRDWVSGVQTTSGTFVKNSAALWDVSGVNGVPTNWTVETASQ